jgi:spermidine synthase
VGHLAVAGISGLTIFVVEFAAIRLLAPAFGQSITIWSVVIGVILVALALGYWRGGLRGERSRDGGPLYFSYGWAALWLLAAGLFGPRLLDLLVPRRGLPDGGLPLGFVGSLVATAVLFGPPGYVLGQTSPFLIRLRTRPGHEGRTTGAIYGVGTLGSLLGCYLAPLVLLQTLGTSGTLVATSLALLAVAALGTTAARHRTSAAQALVEKDVPPVARGFLWIAGLTGFAVTVLEFAAMRFMAPWVGQSNFIWANVIGVLLLALALGSWLGGRIADAALARGPAGGRTLYGLLAAGAIYVGAACWAGPGLLEWLVPQGVESMRILPIAFRGSLAATVLLFGPPLILLGMAPPFLVRMATRGEHVGRTAGVLFACTTVGGLLGCFLTAPLLVPRLGSRGTLLATAVGLAAIAVIGLRPAPEGRRYGRVAATGAGLFALALLAIELVGRAPLRVQPGQVREVESAYQTIRIVRQDVDLLVPFTPEVAVPAELGEHGMAWTYFLRHDEDAETYQSMVLEDPEAARALLTGGRYFEQMALGAWFDRPQRATLRVLIIGYAGGTVYRTMKETAPPGVELDVIGVEIDGTVIDVARDHLRHRELEGEGLTLVTGVDARTVVNALPEDQTFDLVLVDAYARTNYLPFQLATLEFFEHVRDHLAPGGWVGVNVLGDGMKSPVARAVGSTMAKALERTYVAPNPAYFGNVILWASKDAPAGPRIRGGRAMHPGMAAAAYALERLSVRFVPGEGAVVLTDDLSPSDRLADRELGL